MAPKSRTRAAPQPLPYSDSVIVPLKPIQLGRRNHARGDMSINKALANHRNAKTVAIIQPIICTLAPTVANTKAPRPRSGKWNTTSY